MSDDAVFHFSAVRKADAPYVMLSVRAGDGRPVEFAALTFTTEAHARRFGRRFDKITSVGDCVALLHTSLAAALYDHLDALTGQPDVNRLEPSDDDPL
jgi:hypothetical protein